MRIIFDFINLLLKIIDEVIIMISFAFIIIEAIIVVIFVENRILLLIDDTLNNFIINEFVTSIIDV